MSYIFVIDTDTYAGNFEREMTAYMSGQIGECEVGKERKDVFVEEVGDEHLFDNLITSRSDDHGCFRPCAIWPTPGWFNNGMGGHFRDGQEDEAKEDHRQMCIEESKKHGGDHWLESADAPLVKHDAYLSVAIFMGKKPSKDEIKLLKERALKWSSYVAEQKAIAEGEYCFLESGAISGFRLLHEETTETELEI